MTISVSLVKNVLPLAFNQFTYEDRVGFAKSKWEEGIQTANNVDNYQNMGKASAKSKLNATAREIGSCERKTKEVNCEEMLGIVEMG